MTEHVTYVTEPIINCNDTGRSSKSRVAFAIFAFALVLFLRFTIDMLLGTYAKNFQNYFFVTFTLLLRPENNRKHKRAQVAEIKKILSNTKLELIKNTA